MAVLKQQQEQGQSLRSMLAVLIWLGAIHLNSLVALLVITNLRSSWAIALLATFLLLMVVPCDPYNPVGMRIAKFVCQNAPQHFPIKFTVEDEAAFDPNRAYVFAAEPHSVLPLGIISMCNYTGYLPLTNIKALASSAIFYTPVLRQIWTWLGLVPASRKGFAKLLEQRYSCIIVPGGVQECLYMQEGHEVVFLKQRYGFVRIALEAGVPLVPVFCFGQTNAFHWWKPSGKWYNQISRTLGFTPLVFWGMYGPIPYRQPIHVAVGRPIEVEKVLQPSKEKVAEVLERFITALEELYQKHKEDAGYKNTPLHIY
ncbi:hypothetical protein O6H91_15G042400 [Diphasiastrum complanatum]|uniref:Uncharacterized protein n=1 Tax=Diphasiastrum complanatum TaxID=34168 RepID=A0ACC2BHK9_DIPCM|nr:hypothetical protein O6H91_15G042400 [Diphasiastrum complanatum]